MSKAMLCDRPMCNENENRINGYCSVYCEDVDGARQDIASLEATNANLLEALEAIYEGPHHSAIDATLCPDLVEWAYKVIDSAGDAIRKAKT